MQQKEPTGPIEALHLALSLEIEAFELYKGLAAKNTVATDTFLFLADEEAKHRALIEKRIFELTK